LNGGFACLQCVPKVGGLPQPSLVGGDG